MKRNQRQDNDVRVKVATRKSTFMSSPPFASPDTSRASVTSQGFLAILVFLALSAVGVWGVQFQSSISQNLSSLLGSAPPVMMINVALAVYVSCAFIQILPRALESKYRYKGWSHIAFLSVFYIFHFFAGALQTNLVAIFVCGALLLVFESVAIKVHNRKKVDEIAD